MSHSEKLMLIIAFAYVFFDIARTYIRDYQDAKAKIKHREFIERLDRSNR